MIHSFAESESADFAPRACTPDFFRPLGVIDAAVVAQRRLVILVTARDQHALRAFEVRTLDYLLKPFDRDRVMNALGPAAACSSFAPTRSTGGSAGYGVPLPIGSVSHVPLETMPAMEARLDPE